MEAHWFIVCHRWLIHCERSHVCHSHLLQFRNSSISPWRKELPHFQVYFTEISLIHINSKMCPAHVRNLPINVWNILWVPIETVLCKVALTWSSNLYTTEYANLVVFVVIPFPFPTSSLNLLSSLRFRLATIPLCQIWLHRHQFFTFSAD